MIEIVLIVLLIVLLAGRWPVVWNSTEPLSFILSVVLMVLLVVLVLRLGGLMPARW